jgi:DNA-binding CsgD family transcriptional regulator
MGAGVWWAIAILQFMPLGKDPSVTGPRLSLAALHAVEPWLLWAAFALLLGVGSRLFSKQGYRMLCACLVLLLALGSSLAAIAFYLLGFESELSRSLITVLFVFAYTILLFLWGVRFALLDIEDAESTVLYTACFAFICVFIVIQLPVSMLYVVKIVAVILSAACFIIENRNARSWQSALGGGRVVGVTGATDTSGTAGGKRAAGAAGKTRAGRVASVASGMGVTRMASVASSGLKPTEALGFYLSRLLLGLGIGLCGLFTVLLPSQRNIMGLGGSIVAILALLVLVFLYSQKRLSLAKTLPLLPLVSVFLATSVFAPSGMHALALSAGAVTWFVWVAFSSLRLSDIRERGAENILRMACFEKFLIIAPLCLIRVLSNFYPVNEFISNTWYATWIPLVILFCAILGITFQILGIGTGVQSGTRDDRSLALYDEAYGILANEYGLSAREQEVLSFLGRGYTRTAISEKLFIADGTTRTHIRHIHEKMRIHRNDELIDALHDKMLELSKARAQPEPLG